MNFGDCPYDDCDGYLALAVPEHCPAFIRTTCPDCKRPVWYRLSRVAPNAWTPEEFAALYTVDEEAGIVTPKQAAG